MIIFLLIDLNAHIYFYLHSPTQTRTLVAKEDANLSKKYFCFEN